MVRNWITISRKELDNHQPKDHSATAYSKILSPSCGSVMVLRHIYVCFRAAMALAITLTITVSNYIKCLTQNRIPFCLFRETNGVRIERYRAIHSFSWHAQNATIPSVLMSFFHSSVMYFFLPPFSTNYSSVLPHFILPSISRSTYQSCFSKIHI